MFAVAGTAFHHALPKADEGMQGIRQLGLCDTGVAHEGCQDDESVGVLQQNVGEAGLERGCWPRGWSCERMSSMTVVPWFSSMYRRVMVPPLSLRMSAMMVLFGCKMKAFGPSVLHLRDAACDL